MQLDKINISPRFTPLTNNKLHPLPELSPDERNRLGDDTVEALVFIISNATSLSIDCQKAIEIFSEDKEMLKEVILSENISTNKNKIFF